MTAMEVEVTGLTVNFECRIRTPKPSNQNVVFIVYAFLIGCFFSSLRTNSYSNVL